MAKTLIDKLSENFKVIQKMKTLFPSNCLNQLRPSVDQLPLEFKENDTKLDIDSQWRNLINIDWKVYFEDNIPNDPAKFWIFLRFFKNASKDFIFKELSTIALKLLSLPLSNAIVERVFSIMNLIKIKIRKYESRDARSSFVNSHLLF